ncbi:MAG: DUF1934 domain-containing protein [Clostridia bacterium]|nr:DUF1934 domain-containing protein [Clostridia bacterium]
MCYNDFNGQSDILCSVRIITCGGGLDGDISAEGTCKKNNGAVLVNYSTDGDKTTFFFKEGEAEYVRSGSQNIRMPFKVGKTTICEIGYNGMKGSFEVVTRKIEILSAMHGHRVRLEYESGQEGERVELSFTVLYK